MMTMTIAKSFHHLPSRDDCLPRKTKAVAGKSLKKMTDKTNSFCLPFLTTKKHFLVISQSLELSVGKTRHPRNQHTVGSRGLRPGARRPQAQGWQRS